MYDGYIRREAPSIITRIARGQHLVSGQHRVTAMMRAAHPRRAALHRLRAAYGRRRRGWR